VVGDGNAGVAAHPVELLPQRQRRAERDRAGLAVAEAKGRHRRDQHPLGRGQIGESDGEIPAEDLVDLVAPVNAHGANAIGRPDSAR
jgi:hypothetical protein